MNKNKSVYVFASVGGLSKIGVSENIEYRRNVIEAMSGYSIKDIFYTKPCSNPYCIEKEVHKKLAYARATGEWFNVSFGTAVETVTTIFNAFAEFVPEKEFDIKSMINAFIDMPDVEANKSSISDVSSLIEEVVTVMIRQNSPAVKVAKQTEMLLKHFGIPVIPDFVENCPFEQMALET